MVFIETVTGSFDFMLESAKVEDVGGNFGVVVRDSHESFRERRDAVRRLHIRAVENPRCTILRGLALLSRYFRIGASLKDVFARYAGGRGITQPVHECRMRYVVSEFTSFMVEVFEFLEILFELLYLLVPHGIIDIEDEADLQAFREVQILLKDSRFLNFLGRNFDARG